MTPHPCARDILTGYFYYIHLISSLLSVLCGCALKQWLCARWAILRAGEWKGCLSLCPDIFQPSLRHLKHVCTRLPCYHLLSKNKWKSRVKDIRERLKPVTVSLRDTQSLSDFLFILFPPPTPDYYWHLVSLAWQSPIKIIYHCLFFPFTHANIPTGREIPLIATLMSTTWHFNFLTNLSYAICHWGNSVS